jgi:hypothetical protein
MVGTFEACAGTLFPVPPLSRPHVETLALIARRGPWGKRGSLTREAARHVVVSIPRVEKRSRLAQDTHATLGTFHALGQER